jgi:hypothetical protein
LESILIIYIVRSPCPMLNALANHNILPRSGKGITKELAVNTLSRAINLDSKIGSVFAAVALTANPDHTAHFFDLDQVTKHGLIEHDVSLSRNDATLGDNSGFDQYAWDGVLQTYGDNKETNFALVSKARYDRFLACKKAHEAAEKDFAYGIKEFILSYGESALFLSTLGDPENGKIPIEYLKVLFGKSNAYNGLH